MHVRQFTIACCSLIALSYFAASASAQMTMNMTGMENSVGYMSSGTSIEPRTTSESAPMVHETLGKWSVMFHMNATLDSIQQSGPRGGDKLFSTNWLMPMIARQSGRQSIVLRTMLSFEPATVTKRRYPELFQIGESAFGSPIVDAQHPHDAFMEIAGRYEFQFAEKTRLFVYGGPVGEPALGPTAFPHRASNSENPLAILGHHEQDSTHISNSVITVGFVQGPMQLEASTFHGREQGENRWNIDRGPPDSFAARISVAANNHLSGQFSIGRIANREAADPTTDTLRMTASIHHHTTFSSGHIATSVIWGRNKELTNNRARDVSNAYDLESTVKFRSKNWAWLRIENVDREQTGRIQAYTFGYERDLPIPVSFFNLGIGTQVTTYGLPAAAQTAYGARPATVLVFLRLRPVANMSGHIKMMHR